MLKMIESAKRWYGKTFVRFLSVGLMNTILTYIVYLAFYFLLDNYIIAFIISFIVGCVFTAIMNVKHAFKVEASAKKYIIYILYYTVYLFVNTSLIRLLVEQVDIDPVIAPALSLCVMVPLHYVCSKRLLS